MNLLEHCIKEIHSVTDITVEYEKRGHKSPEPLLEVDMTIVCYGVTERTKKQFWKSEFELAKIMGHYYSYS